MIDELVINPEDYESLNRIVKVKKKLINVLGAYMGSYFGIRIFANSKIPIGHFGILGDDHKEIISIHPISELDKLNKISRPIFESRLQLILEVSKKMLE